jgi:hypothetical protein
MTSLRDHLWLSNSCRCQGSPRRHLPPRRVSRAGFKCNQHSKQNPPKLFWIGATTPPGQGCGKGHGDQLGPVICDVVTGTAPSSPPEARFAILHKSQQGEIIPRVPLSPCGSSIAAQLQVPSTPQIPLGEILRGVVYWARYPTPGPGHRHSNCQIYGGAAAAALAAGIGLLVKASGGWFWTYIFKLHQSHGYRWGVVFGVVLPDTLKHLWPVFAVLIVATVVWPAPAICVALTSSCG